MHDQDRIRELMMASLDGECSEEERRDLEQGLERHPALRVEMRRMEELGRQLSGFKLKDPADAVLEELDASIMRRAGLSLGWLFFLTGALLVFGWFTWQWIIDPELPELMRWGGVALFVGLLVLLIVKIRERLVERRTDPYRDVIR